MQKNSTIVRTYHELIQLPSFKERYEYLRLAGKIGEDTFGFDRYLNQAFYSSPEWKKIRRDVIVRDMGNDLAFEGMPIYGKIVIHHMVPITMGDIVDSTEFLLNPNYLVCVSENTHRAIHYGSADLLPKDYVERTANDTSPWRKN